jgi:hypothetical protein
MRKGKAIEEKNWNGKGLLAIPEVFGDLYWHQSSPIAHLGDAFRGRNRRIGPRGPGVMDAGDDSYHIPGVRRTMMKRRVG